MYLVQIENRVRREIKGLPRETIVRLNQAITGLSEDPRPRGAKKLAYPGGWRLRIGRYRLLDTVEEPANIVRIYRFKHRREAYR